MLPAFFLRSRSLEKLYGQLFLPLLERRRQPGNRKTIHLRPTEQAEPIVEQGRAIQRRYGGLLFQGFTEAEREQLARFLNRVSDNVDAALASEEGRA